VRATIEKIVALFVSACRAGLATVIEASIS
jgi:hypothetical protein